MPNRTELSTTFQRVQGMVEYVRENLDDEEYDLFLDMVAPLPEVVELKKMKKRGAKKGSSKSSTRSSRASGMAAAISDNLKKRRRAPIENPACSFQYNDDSWCTLPEENPIHDPNGGYAGYHPFVSGSDAPSVTGRSSTNGGAKSSTLNSVDETVSAGVAAGGLSD